MYLPRTLWFVPILSLIFLAGAGHAQQPSPTSQTATDSKPPKPKEDKQATQILDEAIKKLDPKELGFVETTLWQQVDMHGVTFRSEGSFLSGPQHRLKLNLGLNLGREETAVKGRLEVVCDGTTLWEAVQIGNGKRIVTMKIDIKKVLPVLEGPTIPAEDRTKFFQEQSFHGVLPLLKTLRKNMVITGKENVQWQGQDVIQLTGVWGEEAAKPVQGRWPQFLPRECRIFLGSQAPHWPYRIEWWAPAPPRSGDGIVMQMEFRNPKWKQQLSAERIAKEFAFVGDVDPERDVTDKIIEALKKRAEQPDKKPAAEPEN